MKLARLHAAGQLRAVTVPEPPLEALRDLVRAREDLRHELMGARHHVSKMLLRRGVLYDGPGETWSPKHRKWLTSARFDEPLAEVVFSEYLACHDVLLARRDRLDRLIAEQATSERWGPLVGRLRCLRGIDTLSAVGLVAEIGDPTAFARPTQLASYLGLVPSEQSSGDTRRLGSITKAGSSHARRLLIEAAWHYRRPARVSADLKTRQKGQPAAVIDTAWRAQLRLYQRWMALTMPAESAARPSPLPSRESSPISSGRSPDNPTNPQTHNPCGVSVAAGARITGSAIEYLSTDTVGALDLETAAHAQRNARLEVPSPRISV